MRFPILAAAALAVSVASGYLVSPPGVAAPLTISTCSAWHAVVASDTCASVIASYGLTLARFVLYNPVAGSASSCTLLTGFDFCVQINLGVTTSTSSSSSAATTATTLSTSTTTSSTNTTSTGNVISTPTPYQTGMTASCSNFHLVVSGDQCGTIASAAGISLDSFYAWNPTVGSTCSSLLLGYYVCINVLGGTTSISTSTTTSAATTTSAGNGISTPTPYQSGMTTSCDSFHLVVSGDECGTIATAAGVSLASFYAWNPAVGSTCSSLWAEYYVCVNVIGGTASEDTIAAATTTTAAATTTIAAAATTTAGNGVATPTPIEIGMTTSCSTFHLVVSGDQCGTIATAAGITTDQFYAWNTNVGSTCASLWLGYYVCIGVL